VLFGRERECERLLELIADAQNGRSRALVVRGDPGVGKTALLEFAIHEAEGFEVLHVAGVESEAELPYAGLHVLLRPLEGFLDELPDVQANALRIALGLREGAPDPFLAGAGALTLLAHAADRRSLLVAVDDAHWIDRASLDTLLFVARRLAAEAIAVLLVVRSVENALERGGLETLVVNPLPEDAALALLSERWGADLETAVARQLISAIGGNPLALVEMSQQLSEEERVGLEPLPEVLPVSSAVGRSVLLRLKALSQEAREATLLVAVDDLATPIVAAEALAEAEEAGLLQRQREGVVFLHPLFRAAVLQTASQDDVRTAHRRVAEVLTKENERDLRAWHLAAAAVGHDEEAAAALEAASDRAEARGGTAARARALERAAELSADDVARGRRLYGAARAAAWAGETQHARALLERALPEAHDPLVRADLLHALTAIVDWQGPPVPAEVLEHQAATVAELDADRAAQLLIQTIPRFTDHRLDVRNALRVADRLEALLPRLGSWWRPRALGNLAFVHILAGHAVRTNELVDEMLEDPLAAATQGLLLIRLERYEDAKGALAASLELGRSAGQPLRIAWTQTCFGSLHSTLGRTPLAIAALTEAASVASEIEAYSVAAWATVKLAEIAGDQGQDETRERLLTDARELGHRLSDEHTQLSIEIVEGRGALLAGRYNDAVDFLEPVARRTHEAGLRDPTFVPHESDLVEAHVRRGDHAAARATLDAFTDSAGATGCRWALAAVARYEGMLADDSDFDGRFAAALALHADARVPLAEARTRLCYGERLRRVRRRRDAREQLAVALELFDEVGAAALAKRARAELEATGISIPRRDPTAPERLTPQELQIALQVAEGKLNREVAATLFLSPKTVEYHLTHVYRKLDINSRAELIRLFASEVPRRAPEMAHEI